jgi:hypothetical protein
LTLLWAVGILASVRDSVGRTEGCGDGKARVCC